MAGPASNKVEINRRTMTADTQIKLFEDKKVRTVWDEVTEE